MKIGFVLCAAALSAVEIVKIPSTPYNERAIIKSMYAETGKLGGKKNPLVLQTVDFPLGVMAQGKTETLKGYRQNANGSTILLWVYGPGEQYRLSIVKQDATPFAENNTLFTFHLREAKWSDGKDITAFDFVQTWKDMLEPKFPCPNAHLLYPIKNAENAKRGLLSDKQIGVRAIDYRTLEVRLEKPTPFGILCIFDGIEEMGI